MTLPGMGAKMLAYNRTVARSAAVMSHRDDAGVAWRLLVGARAREPRVVSTTCLAHAAGADGGEGCIRPEGSTGSWEHQLSGLRGL